MTFEQIGQKLKSAREGQGLTLTQIWERTKIPMHHLQSMETGVTDDLPETVYVAGFIKRYADVVGLNGQNLSDEYRKEAVTEPSGNGNGHHFARPQKVKSGAPQMVVVPAPYMGKTRMDSGPPSLMKMLVFPALSVLMLISLIAVLLKWHSDTSANQLDPSILALGSKYNQIAATAPTVPPPTANATASQPAVQENAAPSSVTINASKHVWLDVKSMSNNDSLFTGFLEAGDRRDFKDSQGIRIHAGNGGSVTVEYEGKSETLGANGKISEKTYLTKGANPAANGTGTPSATDGKTGSTLTGGANGALSTTGKPVIKKPVKKPDAAARRRRLEEAPSRQYIPGESLGGRSNDVPYRYTEGRLDTDQ